MWWSCNLNKTTFPVPRYKTTITTHIDSQYYVIDISLLSWQTIQLPCLFNLRPNPTRLQLPNFLLLFMFSNVLMIFIWYFVRYLYREVFLTVLRIVVNLPRRLNQHQAFLIAANSNQLKRNLKVTWRLYHCLHQWNYSQC